jgi:hypothetical protein
MTKMLRTCIVQNAQNNPGFSMFFEGWLSVFNIKIGWNQVFNTWHTIVDVVSYLTEM